MDFLLGDLRVKLSPYMPGPAPGLPEMSPMAELAVDLLAEISLYLSTPEISAREILAWG